MNEHGSFRVLCALSVTAFLLVLALPDASEARTKSPSRGCRLQKAQHFLKRSNFVRNGQLNGKLHLRAARWRAERYGSIEGVPDLERYNRESAHEQAISVRFMGLPLQIHKKVAPALDCVERRIRRACKKSAQRYTPHAVGGFRRDNTYRGGEISNHLFGIAVDIDPEKNPCCGCVDPWPDHPACKGSVESVYERTALTKCWVSAFERYGFYWLGRDPDLRDTMHFEFLGDPDRILVP